MSEVSATRLYLGNLPRAVTKSDVQAHFEQHGTGEITEIKLMNGFGFIEYKDALDARDVVPAFHGSTFMGERLTVQFARGSRARESFGHNERVAPRPRRTPFRMMITGLPIDTSWQDLKDFARQSSLDVVYSETPRDGFGRGYVEFETAADLRSAVDKLDGREFKPGHRVNCSHDVHPNEEPPIQGRGRSRSPIRRPPYIGNSDDYDRRQTLRTYSPRRDGYRDDYREEYDYRRTRSPGRDHFDDRVRYRSLPRPTEDYGPRQNRYEDAFRRNYPNPEPFPSRVYDRAPPRVIPPRDIVPRDIGFQPRDGGVQPRDGGFSSRDGGYPRDYDRGRYW